MIIPTKKVFWHINIQNLLTVFIWLVLFLM